MNSRCNNCGKTDHSYYQCKLPIISFGIILFRKTARGNEYLMIRRKDSFGYIDFVRGKYSMQNIEQIQQAVDQMSSEEKERLLTESFSSIWLQLWGDTGERGNRGEEFALSKKFETVKSGIIKGAEIITLQKIIENSPTTWQETEWEFPKGRKNAHEKDLECATREFEEETGLSRKNLVFIENIIPYEEVFIGSNHKAYKHKYFLACYDVVESGEEEKELFQKTEVSKIDWKTLDECLSSIRPYNIEKKKIIQTVDQLLRTFTII
jgi:8-oxo-dGTP pyrophosphatase MutT (NUDIX family)